MPTIDLLYDMDCPNVTSVREQLLRAFENTRVSPHWIEWQNNSPDAPAYTYGYGSPTILVDGKDVANSSPSNGVACCRVYSSSDGKFSGIPSVDQISSAILASVQRGPGSIDKRHQGWKASLVMLPGILFAALPKIVCPACWPAYTGFLTAIGLGFLLNVTYLLPLTAVFLAVAVGALAYYARKQKSYRPFLLGIVSAVTVLIGKFWFENDMAMYTGLAALVAASIWNTLSGKIGAENCPACVSTTGESEP